MSQLRNNRKDPEEDKLSVVSENQADRFDAHRLRIEESNRRMLADESQEEQPTKQIGESQKQLEESEEQMMQVQHDGMDALTNIRVAANFRESQRRTTEDEAKRQRNEKLENEAKTSLEKFGEITDKWTVAQGKEIPQDLQDALVSQQQLCALFIEDKNKLINDLQEELKTCNNLYVKDMKRHGEDVDLMTERMEEQKKNLMKSKKEEYEKIKNTFERERMELLHRNRMEWVQKMKGCRDKDAESLMQRMMKVEESKRMLQKLRLDATEECNAYKNKLDNEVQVLQQQVQQIKDPHRLNPRNLHPNLHALKRLEEENTVTKTQQKRMIIRLWDTLANFKAQCVKQEKQTLGEKQSITDDHKGTAQEIKRREKKIKQLLAADTRKFEEIGLMNEVEVKALVERALEMDQLVHEKYLGLRWQRPSTAFMECSGSVLQQLQAPILGSDLPLSSVPFSSYSGKDIGTQSDRISAAAIQRILELLCDEAGLLIESKVAKLLAPLDKDEKNLIKLDEILSAIGIETREDRYKIAEFFKNYAQWQEDQESAPKEEAEPAGVGALAGVEKPVESSRVLSSHSWELFDPNDVMGALQAFTAEHCKPRETKQQSKIQSMDTRNETDEGAFWESAVNIIPESKLKLWDTLETALGEYYDVLTERSKLLEDTQHLKVQNEEIKLLLRKLCNSVPPSKKVMQILLE